MRSPIHSNKHYVSSTNATTVSGTVKKITWAKAVAQNAVTAAQDVVEGSVVKALYIELWFLGQGATGIDTQVNTIIEKVVAGQASATAANLANLQAYPNKKNVFFSMQGVMGDKFTNSVPLFRSWMKLPKGKQRMGLGDSIVMSTVSTGQSMQTCGMSTYKEYM